jgi:hypothetical protein
MIVVSILRLRQEAPNLVSLVEQAQWLELPVSVLQQLSSRPVLH